MSQTKSGIGIGAVVAGVLSWTVNHSIVWMLIHILCGWFYVVWYVLNYR
jgi:hypothetical protein